MFILYDFYRIRKEASFPMNCLEEEGKHVSLRFRTLHTVFSVALWDKNDSRRIFILSFWQACSLNFNKKFYLFIFMSINLRTKNTRWYNQSNDVNTWFDQTSKKKKTDKSLIRTCNITFHNISRSTESPRFFLLKIYEIHSNSSGAVAGFLIQGEFWFS